MNGLEALSTCKQIRFEALRVWLKHSWFEIDVLKYDEDSVKRVEGLMEFQRGDGIPEASGRRTRGTTRRQPNRSDSYTCVGTWREPHQLEEVVQARLGEEVDSVPTAVHGTGRRGCWSECA